MTRDEAAKLARESREALIASYKDDIFKHIEKAAKSGNEFIDYIQPDPPVQKIDSYFDYIDKNSDLFESLGYDVEYITDWSKGAYYRISWE